MSEKPASARGTPWFVPANPARPDLAASNQAAPTPFVKSAPVNCPGPGQRLVNWPVVLAAGAFVWFWIVGAILVGWLASSPPGNEPSAPQVSALPPPSLVPVVQAVQGPEPIGFPALVLPPEQVAVPQPEPVALKPAAPAKEEVGKYGTAIDFVDDPSEAADLAQKNRKVLFVLHVSGDLEDPGCT